jgi:6-phosphogluconate dehydrogenase
MELGMVGLGRMGLNMARRLARGGHQVVAYNRTYAKAADFARECDAKAVESLAELATVLSPPRLVWLMLPASAVDSKVAELSGLLAPGDLVVDGGNCWFRDASRRARILADQGVGFLDAGVSGGIWGLEEGYCLMVGGEAQDFARIEPALATLAPADGYLHAGPLGAGHYTKMVHNGIEYGLMQAYAEGLALMEAGPYADQLDFQAVCRLWNHGSVVRSWLLELLERAFTQDPRLSELAGYVGDSGEGRWCVNQAVEDGVSTPVLSLALMNRFRSRQEDSFADKVVAALRNQFGGHEVKKIK